MDPQNEPFPVPIQRNVAGMTVIEYQQLPYPFFVDVRQDSMAAESPVLANLPAVTLHWVSPVEVDEEKNQDREVVTLLQSTAGSWLRSSININPDLQTSPKFGFPVEGEQKARPLAVSIRGSFESYFKDKPSPFQEGETEASALGTVEVSPDSSRLVVLGSAEFVDDVVMEISRSFSQDRYLLNLQLLQNIVDWAVEDEDLLSIRSRGTYARLLRPLEKDEQSFWEGLNYALALLAGVGAGQRGVRG